MDKGYDSSDDEVEQEIKCRRSCSEILPQKLYISSCDVAAQESVIQRHAIKGVISLGDMSEWAEYKVHPDPIQQLFVPICDHAAEPIREHFKECVDFINSVDGAVLVHCAAGVSRSATIVIAYLILHEKMEYHNAIAFVKQRRRIIKPNHGFLLQLREL